MHVVFDLDGVLLDSDAELDWLDRALESTLAEFDIPATEDNIEWLFPASVSNFRTAASSFDVPVMDLWRTRDRYYVQEKTRAIETGAIGPFPGMDVVSELGNRYPLSIISNSPEVVLHTFLETTGFEDAFEAVIGRGRYLESIERAKPHPEPYERLHESVNAGRYVYVGDTNSDREFADRTGMEYIYLDRTNGDISSLEDVRRRIDTLAY